MGRVAVLSSAKKDNSHQEATSSCVKQAVSTWQVGIASLRQKRIETGLGEIKM